MARPTRQGVDYFPLDVHLDNKFKFIEIKFGLQGFAVVIKILQEIYAQGYFCDWGEDEKLLFSNEHNVDFEELCKISDECLSRDIFDKKLYEKYEILTSKGIQSRYKEIVRRRKNVDVTKDYLLINGAFGLSDDKVTTPSKHHDGKSTQSKVKESKVKESKVKESKEEDLTSKTKSLLTSFSSIKDFNSLNKKYWNVIRETRKTGKIANSVIYNTMKKWEKYDPVIIEYALKTHIEGHAGKREEYTIGIMRRTSKQEAEDRLDRLYSENQNNQSAQRKEEVDALLDKFREG